MPESEPCVLKVALLGDTMLGGVLACSPMSRQRPSSRKVVEAATDLAVANLSAASPSAASRGPIGQVLLLPCAAGAVQLSCSASAASRSPTTTRSTTAKRRCSTRSPPRRRRHRLVGAGGRGGSQPSSPARRLPARGRGVSDHHASTPRARGLGSPTRISAAAGVVAGAIAAAGADAVWAHWAQHGARPIRVLAAAAAS